MSDIELARKRRVGIRPARASDIDAILHFLQNARFAHIHSDWHMATDWIGEPGFVILVDSEEQSKERLLGLLAVGADPLPSAWVRLAAVDDVNGQGEKLRIMMQSVVSALEDTGVREICWMTIQYWPESWLTDLGFSRISWILTYVAHDLETPDVKATKGTVRNADVGDLERLAQIEEAAFEPMWRHSVSGLALAFDQAFSFKVCEQNNLLVGFQYSVRGQATDSAHLVRITVAPESQRQGIGSLLLNEAFHDYRAHGINHVSLNTQSDNVASHFLYRKFGFRRQADRVPVWRLSL